VAEAARNPKVLRLYPFFLSRRNQLDAIALISDVVCDAGNVFVQRLSLRTRKTTKLHSGPDFQVFACWISAHLPVVPNNRPRHSCGVFMRAGGALPATTLLFAVLEESSSATGGPVTDCM
jgi:hypothetical protein